MRYNVIDYSTRETIDFTFENPFSGKIGEAFETFHSIYEPDMIVTHPKKKPKLNSPRERACRFCIKEYPEVTFKKEAHVFPKLMGNRNIIHDCECDTCNAMFGTYEDSFAKFMGMSRTTDFIKGKGGVPSFESGDGKFRIRYGIGSDGEHLIKLEGSANDIVSVENGIQLIATKQAYTPLHVLKTLYKIGYSFIDAIDIPHFNPTRKIITSNELDGIFKGFAGIIRFTYPSVAHSPMAVRYKKKVSCESLRHPSTVIMIHFNRYAYQFFLVDNRDTFMFEQNAPFEFLFAPPPFPGVQKELLTEKIELSATEKREGEIDSAIFTFDWENDAELLV